jgi:hypothetical protein
MLNEVNGTLLETQSNITHIFFESDNHILEVSDDSLNTGGQGVGILANGKLQYFDFPTSLRYINAYTFSKYPFMRLPIDRANNIVINSNLVYIGENAFNSSGDGT